MTTDQMRREKLQAGIRSAEEWLTHPLITSGVLSALPVQGTMMRLRNELAALDSAASVPLTRDRRVG